MYTHTNMNKILSFNMYIICIIIGNIYAEKKLLQYY